MITNRIGLIVKISLVNGHIVTGAIREWTPHMILVVATNGEVVEIMNPSRDIISVTYIEKLNGELVSERSQKDVEPQHNPGDIEELAVLAKLRAETDREEVKSLLSSSICSVEEKTYDSQLSILPGIKNNSR